MSEKIKALADEVSALPPAEFGPHNAPSIAVATADCRLDETLFDAPIMTAEQVRDQIHTAMLSMEALKIIDGGSTPYLETARAALGTAFANVSAHKAAVIARDLMDEAQSRVATEYRR